VIAEELDVLNRQRRADQDAIFTTACEMAERYADEPVLVLAHEDWSHGVVGIVASKLVEKWHKPVLVAQIMGGSTKGSARSFGAFNMVEALRANAAVFTKFGGHFYAAGYTLPTERLDDLRAGMKQYYLSSDAQDFEAPKLEADVRVDDLSSLGWEMLRELEMLEPHGSGNPRPLLEVTGVTVDRLAKIGKDGRHLRLGLRDKGGRRLAAIGFGLCERYPDVAEGHNLTVMAELNKNEYQGRESLQLGLSELRYEQI
jgi:single-stranded-DNA-specific exonuclease